MMNKARNYIGIARKAGLLEVGEMFVAKVAQSGKAKLILLAEDASDNARRRASGFAWRRKTPLITLPMTKNQLSDLLGKPGCSMLAVTDAGIAFNLVSALADDSRVEHIGLLKELAEDNIRGKKRKKEQIAYNRNKKIGKKTGKMKVRRAKYE